jgi:hypothetical protein
MNFYLGKKAAGRTQACNEQSVGTSSFGATAHMMMTCFVRATSLALICLLKPASFGQTTDAALK